MESSNLPEEYKKLESLLDPSLSKSLSIPNILLTIIFIILFFLFSNSKYDSHFESNGSIMVNTASKISIIVATNSPMIQYLNGRKNEVIVIEIISEGSTPLKKTRVKLVEILTSQCESTIIMEKLDEPSAYAYNSGNVTVRVQKPSVGILRQLLKIDKLNS